MPGKRKRKRQGIDLNRGPFTAGDIDKHLRRAGYERIPGGKHWNYRHASRPGKVSVSSKWTGVRVGDPIFNSLARQSGYGKAGLHRLLNGLDP